VQLHEGLGHEAREFDLEQRLGVLHTQQVGQLHAVSTFDT
jgi:hypothetical protein